jgi:GTP pyrophosphokinase
VKSPFPSHSLGNDHAYSQQFDEAVALAMDAFRLKRRKSTAVPYITHLFAVCAKVGEHGGTETQMIAAVLHDFLEDVEWGTRELLEQRFGPEVTAMVVAMSDTEVIPKPPWKERKDRYLATVAGKDPAVKLITAADKLHNCSTIITDHTTMGDAIFERFSGKKTGTLWYYRSVVIQLGTGWQHPILDHLTATVVKLHRVSGEPWDPR